MRASFDIKADEPKKDVDVAALVKGDERYIFIFTQEKKAEVLRTLGRLAIDEDLSFTWYDAAVLSQRIRNGDTS